MNAWHQRACEEKLAKAPPWVEQLRQDGAERFKALGFPTTRLEDWKYTNVQGLSAQEFQNIPPPHLSPADLLPHTHGPAEAWRAVFVNGVFVPTLSQLQGLPGKVVVNSIREILGKTPEALEPHLGRIADCQKAPFTALNLAGFSDGTFVKIPRGTLLEKPLEILHVSLTNGVSGLAQTRNVIVAETGSQATVVETYTGQGASSYLVNAVTEIETEAAAVLEHYQIQTEGPQGYHLRTTAVRQGRQSLYRSLSVSLGAALNRHELGALLDDEGAECVLNGLYVAQGKQHVDNQTHIDHAKPHCTSSELYKGILGGQAQGVFNGKILVRADAQKTQARQTNKNLILSKDAIVNTKPLLEIFANDVKCNHGATIGRLDENQLFYLRSRGIGEDLAKNLLTYAFASELIQGVRLEGLKKRLENYFIKQLNLGSFGAGLMPTQGGGNPA